MTTTTTTTITTIAIIAQYKQLHQVIHVQTVVDTLPYNKFVHFLRVRCLAAIENSDKKCLLPISVVPASEQEHGLGSAQKALVRLLAFGHVGL